MLCSLSLGSMSNAYNLHQMSCKCVHNTCYTFLLKKERGNLQTKKNRVTPKLFTWRVQICQNIEASITQVSKALSGILGPAAVGKAERTAKPRNLKWSFSIS